jgi:hypothetical protein
MVTPELRCARYPFAARAAAPRVDPTLCIYPGQVPGFFVAACLGVSWIAVGASAGEPKV